MGVEVEHLVNNAGFGSNGGFLDLDLARELEMIQLNCASLLCDVLRVRFAPRSAVRKTAAGLNRT